MRTNHYIERESMKSPDEIAEEVIEREMDAWGYPFVIGGWTSAAFLGIVMGSILWLAAGMLLPVLVAGSIVVYRARKAVNS